MNPQIGEIHYEAEPWKKYEDKAIETLEGPRVGDVHYHEKPWEKFDKQGKIKPEPISKLGQTAAYYAPEALGFAGGMAAGLPGAVGGAIVGKVIEHEHGPGTPPEGIERVTGPLVEGGKQGLEYLGGKYIGKGAKILSQTPPGKAVMDVSSRVGRFIHDKAAKGLGIMGEFATGVDRDALSRQFTRPFQTSAAEKKGFKYSLGKEALEDIGDSTRTLGMKVRKERDDVLRRYGNDAVTRKERQEILDEGMAELNRHMPSPNNLSKLSPSEITEVSDYLGKITDARIEDLVKLREALDVKLSAHYGTYSGPYLEILKDLRGMADKVLDRRFEQFAKANTQFHDLAKHKAVLGMTEKGAEGQIGSLFGANKTAKQEAAKAILSPEIYEKALDVSANKIPIGPAGSESGLRNMLKMAGLFEAGVSHDPFLAGAVLMGTSPTVWKHGLRTLGKTGIYVGKTLEAAAKQSPQALAITYKMLYEKIPEFRQFVDTEKQRHAK